MNYAQVLIPLVVLLSGCARAAVPRHQVDGASSGAIVASSSLRLGNNAGNVNMRLSASDDSVRWSLHTTPRGCAAAVVNGMQLSVRDASRDCRTDWTIDAPHHIDLDIRTGVGDIVVETGLIPSFHAQTSVGKVRVVLDGLEFQTPRAPGSGDRMELSGKSSEARLDLRAGVGNISVTMNSSRAR